MIYYSIVVSFLVAFFLIPFNAYAYLGPGLGAGTIGAILGVIVSIFVALFAVVYYPIKRFLKRKKAARTTRDMEREDVDRAKGQEHNGDGTN